MTSKPAVLVIDDEEVMRIGCQQVLSDEGCRVGPERISGTEDRP